MYSSVEVNSYLEFSVESSRKFSIDLVGPRVLFCADQIIDLILKTEVNQYMEFKGIDGSYVGDGEGRLESVPDSRSAIFKDKKLSLLEKNRLMRFFKMVTEHVESEEEGEKRIAEEDLEMPFMEFLSHKMGLSKKLREIILYAIAMADYDQEDADVCKDLLKTKDGINRLGLYHSSVGRFPNAPGAMIYPIYGQGELPQAFCRRAAVKGCIYVLRMPVVFLLMNKESGTYKGVKLESGQELFSNQVIFAPSFIGPSPEDSPSVSNLPNHVKDLSLRDSSHKLAKGICILNASIKPDVANCLVFYPPRSLNPEQVTSVRVLQLSSNVAVCPPGMFVTYLSAPCDDYMQGKNLLQAAIDVLFSIPVSGSSANSTTAEENENAEANLKPSLLWSAFYIQELTSGAHDSIVSAPMPDGDLHYNNIVDVTKKLFQKMYPEDEFFPVTNPADKIEDDSGPEVEL